MTDIIPSAKDTQTMINKHEWEQINKYIEKGKVVSAIFRNIKTGEKRCVEPSQFKEYQ